MNETTESKNSPVLKIIGCGCLALVLLGVIGGGSIFFGIAKLLKNNEPYHDSIAAVATNPAAVAALGEPIKPGFFPTGSINLNNGAGTVDFNIPVSGPNGKGTIHVKGSKAAGAPAWTYETWELKVDGNPDPIPLSGGGGNPPGNGN